MLVSQEAISVSLGRDVGVAEPWCWCASLPSGYNAGIIRVWCQCCQDAVLVLVSLGCSISIEVVDAQGPSVLATAHGMPHPSHLTCPSWTSTKHFQSVCRMLSSPPTTGNMIPCTTFASAASTLTLLRSKGLKDATCVGWFGNDWDCLVGCPPEAMIMWVARYRLATQYNE